MNLEFVKLNDEKSFDKVSLDDVFEFEVPDQDMVTNLDCFTSSKYNLTAGTLEFPKFIVDWVKSNEDKVSGLKTYTQLPYGCLDLAYWNFTNKYNHQRQKTLIKSHGKKYPALKDVVTANRTHIFFGIQDDEIIFNMYTYTYRNNFKYDNLHPHSIFKVKLDKIADLAINRLDEKVMCDTSKNDVFEFLGITRDSYNALKLMSTVAGAMYKDNINERFNNIMYYTYSQAKSICMVYAYFMIRLLYYKEIVDRSVKVVGTNEEFRYNINNYDGSYTEITNCEDTIIYLNKYDYIVVNNENTNLDLIKKKSRKGYKIKHSFPVQGYEYPRNGKMVTVPTYMKGKGLPPLEKKQKIYVEKKGDENLGPK